MADRYQDRPFPADDGYDRGGDPHAPARTESDPLAELARLIGQTDPFAMGRANQPVQPRSERAHVPAAGTRCRRRACRRPAAMDAPRDPAGGSGRPARKITSRITRAPCTRCIATRRRLPRRSRNIIRPRPYADAGHESDPSRYDDALYGELDPGAQPVQHDPAHADDPYAYQDGYGDDAEEPARKRGGGMMTVAVVLALAVVGTGAAFAYRTYVGSPRSGEPPIIKADNSPTKIVPAPSDGSAKVPGPHGDRRWQGKDRSARGSPGRRQCQDRPARGVSAAEPEQQSAVGRERCSGRSAPAGAGNGTLPNRRAAQDQDPCRPWRSG